MAIVQTVDFNDFRNAFCEFDRENQFTYEGLATLYRYLEDLSDEIKEPIDLDVIGICCDYTEYTPEELFESFAPYQDGIGALSGHGGEVTPRNAREIWASLSDDEREGAIEVLVEALQDQTTVLEVGYNGNYILQAY
jgi:hypothetical protein